MANLQLLQSTSLSPAQLIVAAIVAVAPFYEETFSSSVVEMSDLGGLTHGGPPLETPPISIGYSKESNGNVFAANFSTYLERTSHSTISCRPWLRNIILENFFESNLSSLIVDCGFPAVFWECAPVYFDPWWNILTTREIFLKLRWELNDDLLDVF